MLNRQGSEINGGSLGGEGEAKIPPYLFTGSFITILGGARLRVASSSSVVLFFGFDRLRICAWVSLQNM